MSEAEFQKAPDLLRALRRLPGVLRKGATGKP